MTKAKTYADVIKTVFMQKVLKDLEEHRSGIHVSDIVYDCLRRSFFNKKYGQFMDSIDEDVPTTGLTEREIMTFWIGKKIHELPITQLHETPIEYMGVVGTFDEALWIGDDFIIIDKKTCYSPDTEVLTKDGWKKIVDVTLDDYVLTMDMKTRKVKYVKPTDKIVSDFDGELIHYESGAVDMLVTPNHYMWLKKRHWNEFKYISLETVLGTNQWLQIPKYFEWEGKLDKVVIESIEFKAGYRTQKMPPLELDPIKWARFLGWYLSEGFINGRSVCISQTHPENIKHIISIIEDLGWSYTRHGNTIYINFKMFGLGKQIIEHLKKHAYTSDEYRAWNKKVPDYIRHAPKEVIKAFLDEFWRGDGSYSGNSKQRVFITTSYRLASDLQELIFKSGKVATINVKDEVGTSSGLIDGREIVAKHTSYVVTEWKRVNDAWINPARAKRIAYRGKVYDLTVPQYHSLFVRRNGKAYWSGNTSKLPSRPYEHHKTQIKYYALMYYKQTGIKATHGAVIYILKNTAIGEDEIVRVFTFPITDADYDDIEVEFMSKALELQHALDTDTPPDRTPGFMCRYCPWQELCFKVGYNDVEVSGI